MKKILNLCLIAFCALYVSGCSSDESSSVPEILIVKSDVDIAPGGGSGTVEFVSSGKEVTAKVNVDWCRIEEITDSKVRFSVGPNTGYMTRSVLLVLTDGVSSKQVAITQGGAIWKYDTEATRFTVSNVASEIPVDMSGTFPIEVIIPEEATQWLSYEVTEKGFKFKLSENATGSARGTFASVKSGVREVKYALLQYDVSNLLGAWTGVAMLDAPDFGISSIITLGAGAQIVAATGGKYQLQLPIKEFGTTIVLSATYENGAFVIATPQQQNYSINIGRIVYGSIITKTLNGDLFLTGKVALGPVLLDNGKLALTYASNTFITMGLFTSRVPSTTNFTGYMLDFPMILMQRSAN